MTLPIININVDLPSVPRSGHFTRQFWQALGEGRFLLQQCTACTALRFPPGSICAECPGSETLWIEASGRGTLYALTTVHAGPPALMRDGPYTRAIVDLDEGVRLIAEWLGDPETRFDTPVELVVTRYTNGCLFGARSIAA
ncbi:OB-fold domain-containing protein [Novosphingobium sp.]|jgi:uncharacterized OB-fold protein|uniref:Zn-ribbon domain-containing OB-fold protein n=1 Tax=Novosphingobium sp. TaxID=1874826 RepID=UPI0022CAE479|nr:OB-fold domain-containing protein [Novosphingobium sp.]MCZ8018490.1 OB-fold domain-containing protein [Novosphingobium sp.]MCZ8033484.1 OB-fold domain-containing protein [Novosphingobium sp.]MCZ8051939.1 OB-fold domain-containing protein [Novosphingobium sp.]MCZ8060481.1 OB-fold domain-containing protein [Novosphingobium sp.]MCZ8232123.1 OB-fold domain-containing protein [Novosphingobium sp.]